MKITVCVGSSCHVKGSHEVVARLEQLITEHQLKDQVEMTGTFCIGRCQEGVCVLVDGEFVQAKKDLALRFRGLHRAAYNRFYIDDVYQFVTHKVIFRFVSTPIAWFDRHVVDGFMNLLARAAGGAAYAIRDMQSGSVQRYCIWFLGGALGLTILILLIC